ncbi:MAG: YbhB/YbcL family Raf kinase inhibitor-like protein [Euzebyales bacterium]|jgi:Raf kinase inhibitor-like YbhB/YbcL family protein|nr:YbhB/YbcL family Raf kinase inhibitor-like protein [Euzebyales bacterium]
MAAFRLTSPAFGHDEDIPERHTADGGDASPPLTWEGVPEGTKELALVCDDPDADTGVVTHWVVYGIGPDETSLPEGVPSDTLVEDPVSLVQGLNEFEESGYTGPSLDEKRGAHRCFFRLFALDTELDLPPGVRRGELRRAAKDHILGVAELVGIA